MCHANAIVRPTPFEQARLIINLAPALSLYGLAGQFGAIQATLFRSN
jgi:hypothetical protein